MVTGNFYCVFLFFSCFLSNLNLSQCLDVPVFGCPGVPLIMCPSVLVLQCPGVTVSQDQGDKREGGGGGKQNAHMAPDILVKHD